MLSKLINANKSFLRLFSAIILIIATASCDRKQQSGNDENDNGGNNYPEAVYYNVLDDETIAALDIIEQIFSNLGDDVQTTFFKNMLIADINSFADSIATTIGTHDIELGLRKIAYSYYSTDVNGEPIEISSAALWRVYRKNNDTVWHDISPEKIVMVEHFTITSDAEAPTQCSPFEILVTGNTLTIMPDYIGYGLTRHLPHPYLNHELCATNSIDALAAGYTLFDEVASCELKEDWTTCVIGASQGGGNALAVHKFMDTNPEYAEVWKFEYSYAAAGPYNPSLTMEKYFEKGKTSYPLVYPFTLKSMMQSYPDILGKYTEEEMFSDEYLQMKDTIDYMFESKNFTTAEINEVLVKNLRITVDENLSDDEIYLSDIFKEVMFNNNSEVVKDLYNCLDKNDLTIDWTPSHRIRLFYSSGDRTVPYENSIAMKEAFGDKVDATELEEPVDHFEACTLWMIKVFLEGL